MVTAEAVLAEIMKSIIRCEQAILFLNKQDKTQTKEEPMIILLASLLPLLLTEDCCRYIFFYLLTTLQNVGYTQDKEENNNVEVL